VSETFQLVDLWLLFFLILTSIFTGLDILIDYEYRKFMKRQEEVQEVILSGATTFSITTLYIMTFSME
jgi:hypothetical protein